MQPEKVPAEGEIVVGVDGSEEAQRAARWAARQASAEQRVLHVVHCWLWPLFTRDLGPVEGVADSGLQHSAETILADGVAAARDAAPEVKLVSSLIVGQPSSVLQELSATARMIVIGSRGLGGFMGLLLGSVGLQLAGTSRCPVAVVRAGDDPNGPVVVGVDGSPESTTALRDAVEFARLWGSALTIMYVRRSPGPLRRERPTDSLEAAARAVLSGAAARARRQAPEVPVREELLAPGSAAGQLLKAAGGARLIVVGARGKGAFAGAVGSTAHSVLLHAPGSVLIARHG